MNRAASPQSPQGQLRHTLTIGGGIVDGQLSLKWIYSRAFHRRSTVEELVHGFLRRLEVLVERVARSGSAIS